MGNVEYRIQMKDLAQEKFGQAIIAAGGNVFVATLGTAHKATLFDKNGAALTNPIIPTRGFINFFVADTIASVDLYAEAPGGQFKVVKAVVPSGPNEIGFDTSKSEHLWEIPFSIADSVAGTEKDTGFILPAHAFVLNRLHGEGILVTVIETAGAKTMLVGTLSTQSGGAASGFNNATSTATLGTVVGTDGASFSTNAPYMVDTNPAAVNVSYTLVTASVAAEGFILLPVRLTI